MTTAIIQFMDSGITVNTSIKVTYKDTSHIDSILPKEEVVVLTIDTIHIDRATRYNPSPEQCDDTPFNTADGAFIDTNKLRRKELRWCALSWDLIYDTYRQKVAYRDWAWEGFVKFGDTITVMSESKPWINGDWIVHDVMNERYKNSIDFLFHEDNMNPRLGVCEDLVILNKL